MVHFRFFLVAFCIILTACGESLTPTSPNPNPNPQPQPQQTLYAISGRVTSTAGGALAGATVRVTDGPNAGKSATTDASGNYSLTGLTFAGFSVEASLPGYVTSARGGILQAGVTTATADFSLRPDGPRTTFGSGQYVVGSDIAAGRYFAAPLSGCYWERLSGFGGTLSDVIANEFVGFDAGQWIVDILGSDRGFSTDADCRTWSMTPRAAPGSGITPGVWLVGSQIAPGTYRVAAGAGCYWERLRNFQGVLGSIIANDFVANAGTVIVTISPSDAGFHADEDCGSWARTLTLDAVDTPADGWQSSVTVEHNRQLNRRTRR